MIKNWYNLITKWHLLAGHPGQIQVQYVQPPVHGAISAGQTAQYSSQPVSYSATQAAAASTAAQPPPPPQGNPPKSTSEQGAASRSSTPQTKGNSDAGHVVKNGDDEARLNSGMGPDFNQENDRLQNLVKELRAETAKLQKEKYKLKEKVKKLSHQNEGAMKSYTVKDGKCPFCNQDMPKKK